MSAVSNKHSFLRTLIYAVAIMASVGCVATVWFQLSPIEVGRDGVLVWPWSKMSLNERGDFIAGFFAPLALIWALVAVILQQIALNVQRQEMERQREEAEAQTKIFSDELKNLERNDLRSHLQSLERQLQRHALMIREYVDEEFEREKMTDYSERDVELTIQRLRDITKDRLPNISNSRMKNAIDRMCTYTSRFDNLQERAVSCQLQEDFNYFRRYTPYGNLLTSCRKKLMFLAGQDFVEGYYWRFDPQENAWIKKSRDKQGPDSVKSERSIVKEAAS